MCSRARRAPHLLPQKLRGRSETPRRAPYPSRISGRLAREKRTQSSGGWRLGVGGGGPKTRSWRLEGGGWSRRCRECRDTRANAANQILVDRADGHRHGVRYRLGRRAAVTHDAEAVEAEERRAAVLGIVHPAQEAPERLTRQHVPDTTT